jgi:hypothetical protein
MNTWAPKATANGWYPKLNPNGTHVLYGFWEAHLADLSTGTEIRIVSPNGARVMPLGWLDSSTMLFGTETIKTMPSTGPDAIYKVSLDAVRADEVQAVLLFDNDGNSRTVQGWKIPVFCDVGLQPADVPFNFGNARGGHWAISNSNRPWNIKDGLPFRKDIQNQYGVFVAGDHLVTMDKDVALLHFNGTTLVRTLPTDNAFLVNEQGDVLTGYYGTVHCYPFDGGHVDATIAPWGKEGIGAVPVRVGQALWIWTFTVLNEDTDQEETLALGRRLGETDPIVLHQFVGATGGSDVVFVDGHFVIASNSPKGLLTVIWVPIDTPREKLTTPSIVPMAPPAPTAFAGAWWWADSAPGNIATGSPTNADPQALAIIAGEDNISNLPPERRVGLLIYLAGDDDAAAVAAIEHGLLVAAQHGVVPFIYDDRRYGRFNLVRLVCGTRPWVWMPQWTIQPDDEGPLTFAHAMKSEAEGFGGHPFLASIRAYTSCASTSGDPKFDAVPEPQVVAAMNALISQKAVNVPGYLGPIFFAFDRLDGFKHRPAVRAAVEKWTGVGTTVTDARAWADEFLKQHLPVSVTITDYPKTGVAPFQVKVGFKVTAPADLGTLTEVLINGIWFQASGAKEGTFTFTLHEPGTYALALRTIASNGATDQTSQFRIINVTAPVTPPKGDHVTDQQIAEVFSGAFFEDVSKRINAKGTVSERRPAVFAWVLTRIGWISTAYLDIFKRGADLEGYGSRLLLFLQGAITTEAELRKILQDAFNRGDR